MIDEMGTYEAAGWNLTLTETQRGWEARCSLTPGALTVATTKEQAAFMAVASALSKMLDAARSKERRAPVAFHPTEVPENAADYTCELLLDAPKEKPLSERKLRCTVTAVYEPDVDETVEIVNCHIHANSLKVFERTHLYEQVRKGGIA